ncbi:MAG: HNH endonuclease [bacterium]|nr:HNH endonuclease [bacterium]
MKKKQLLTTGECEKLTGIKARKIAELCACGEIEAVKNGKQYSVCLDSLLKWQDKHLNYVKKPTFLGDSTFAFGDLELDFDTLFKPILSYKNADEIFQPNRNEYRLRYLISNTGKVFDVDTGVYLKPEIKNGYYSVNLSKTAFDLEHKYVHILVAYFFCKGWLMKNEVHHIDKNPLNNHCKNLLWVTHSEHMLLHSLMQTDKKAYRKMVTKIRKENNRI